MAVDINNMKELCRLCAQNDVFSKDLLEESNKNILNLVQKYIKIAIQDQNYLPTKICLNCEEKIVCFEMFKLECCKVQETFKKICEDSLSSIVKLENPITVFGTPIKSEVKHETERDVMDVTDVTDEADDVTDDVTEDLVCALTNNDASLTVIDEYPENSEIPLSDHHEDIEADDEYLENLSIASLKKIKRREVTDEEIEAFNEALMKTNLKLKDVIKLNCVFCGEKFKAWKSLRHHCAKRHKARPYVICLCGYLVRSQSTLYKHVGDHRREGRKLRKESGQDVEKKKKKYANLQIKDFVRFNCATCDKACSSWYSLQTHTERVHKLAPILSCVCGLIIKSKSVLYKHIHDHKNPNILRCDKCPKIAKTESAMAKHKMRHIPKNERKYSCASCDKLFNTKDCLKSHVKVHIPIEERKIYHCDLCNLRFTSRSSAASHKRVVHDKIKCYVCDLCGYACGTNGELRQHRAIHSDDKPFVCSKCSKPFKTYSNLKTHMDTHEDTSYECFICRRVLNSRRTLRKHLLVHEDKCRHVCSYCNKAFKRRQTLKVHMYTHTGDKPLSCKWCDERFSYASTLRSHRLRCHPEHMAALATRNILNNTGFIAQCDTPVQ